MRVYKRGKKGREGGEYKQGNSARNYVITLLLGSG